MASPVEIKMATEFMNTMIEQMGAVGSRADQLAQPGAATAIHAAPESHEAYVDLYKTWDNKRGELKDSLNTAQKALVGIRDEFVKMDKTLAQELMED